LLLLSIPEWLGRRIVGLPVIGGLISFLTYPAIALILFNVDVYLWHLPGLYDLTLKYEEIHIVEHLTFMAFGLLNFWPVLSPVREQRLSYPLQILYLFADGMFMMGLGILFTFAPSAFYSVYQTAPRLWGLSSGTDQQIGGLIMWYPGNLPYGVLLVVAFYRWFDGADPSRPQRGERQQAPAHTPSVDPPVPH
jgi:putative membrane protein